MPSRRELLRTFSLTAFAALVPPPARTETLADLIPAGFDWNPAARGALLVVDPAGTERVKTDVVAPARTGVGTPVYFLRALPAYERKAVPLGTLTVVAPTTMVRLAEEPPRSPRLWEGLNRGERIQYLMSTFTPAQWARCSSAEGLSAADMADEEQRAAFLSLLPEPAVLLEGTVGRSGGLTNAKKRRLTGAERQAMRLRLRIRSHFSVRDRKGGGEHLLSAQFRGVPGSHVVQLDAPRNPEKGKPESKSAFGAEVVQEVPNRSKPADLDYAADARLAKGIALTGAKNIADLCERATLATGIELCADFRVAGLSVYTAGDTVRAGDLLQGLALAVCGTWRRIGDTYLLAADRIGAAQRRLLLSDWFLDLDAVREKQMIEWQDQVAKSGAVQQYLAVSQDDPLAVEGELDEKIKQIERDGIDGSGYFMKTAELPPAARGFIGQIVGMQGDRANQWDLTHAHISQQVIGELVLADGTPLRSDFDLMLAPAVRFEKPWETGEEGGLTAMMLKDFHPKGPYALPPGTTMALAVTTPDEASEAARLAQECGAARLWLRTEEPGNLTAALAAGTALPIFAVVDVFGAAADTPAANLDRNLFGEVGPAAAKARAATARWDAIVRRERDGFPPQPAASAFVGPEATIAPASSDFAARLNRLREVAAVSGVAGLVLTDLAPLGYGGERSRAYSSDNVSLIVRAELGYTEEARLSFLRKEGVDPIDLIPFGMRFPADLRTPFFLDNNARVGIGYSGDTDGVRPGFGKKGAQWDTFRAERHRAALRQLRDTIEQTHPGLTVFCPLIPRGISNMSFPNFGPPSGYFEWKAGVEAPSQPREDQIVEGRRVQDPVPSLRALAMPAPHSGQDGRLTPYVFHSLEGTFFPDASGRATEHYRILDLSTMPLADARKRLSRWVKVVPEKQ